MKKFIIYLLVAALAIPLLAFCVSAANTSVPIKPIDFASSDFSYSSVTNEIGDVIDTYTFSNNLYGQYWEQRAASVWSEYLGYYWNDFSVNSSTLSARLRPFGNTDLNIGSDSNTLIKKGYYMPWSIFQTSGTVTFEFSYSITCADEIIPDLLGSVTGVQGYLYIFTVKKDKDPVDNTTGYRIYSKSGFPITYNRTYNSLLRTTIFKISVTFDMADINKGGDGFIPLFTFYNCVTASGESKQMDVSYTPVIFKRSLTYQQKIENQLSSLVTPGGGTNFDPNGYGAGMNNVEDSLYGQWSENKDVISNNLADSRNFIFSMAAPLLAISKLFDLIFQTSLLGSLAYLSISIGIVGAVFGIIGYAVKSSNSNNNKSNSTNNKSNNKKG